MTALSRLARESARKSSIKSKLDIDSFKKNRSGTPKPLNGIYWSVTHKLDFVAGVVSKKKIGIDIEFKKSVEDISDTLYKRIINSDEHLLFKDDDKAASFFRAFTAKEAVLKNSGDGIKGVSKTKIKTVIDEKNLIVEYLNRKYLVESFYFDRYLAAVTKNGFRIQWILE